jgi:exosortase/archaeosortase
MLARQLIETGPDGAYILFGFAWGIMLTDGVMRRVLGYIAVAAAILTICVVYAVLITSTRKTVDKCQGLPCVDQRLLVE